MLSSPSPGQQVQTPQSMPPPPQPSPQPGQPSSQPNSNSPGLWAEAAFTTLCSAVNPSSVMSPAGSSQAEEQQYLDKLKQLSKYIEPLRRMINKIDKNEDRKKDLSKMKSLLDILTDPSKRCPLKTLQKCEIALEKLKNDMAVPTPPPPPVPPTKQQYLCQPLLDAVLANIRSPVFNHSLYRTFVPAMTLASPYLYWVSLPCLGEVQGSGWPRSCSLTLKQHPIWGKMKLYESSGTRPAQTSFPWTRPTACLGPAWKGQGPHPGRMPGLSGRPSAEKGLLAPLTLQRTPQAQNARQGCPTCIHLLSGVCRV
uniref:ARC105/Med15 mediator subunit central domain-containing protein n=1 Tax=Panthera tigris altaica TaxID=74533 RepID=A0A8C9JIG4_PANTA